MPSMSRYADSSSVAPAPTYCFQSNLCSCTRSGGAALNSTSACDTLSMHDIALLATTNSSKPSSRARPSVTFDVNSCCIESQYSRTVSSTSVRSRHSSSFARRFSRPALK